MSFQNVSILPVNDLVVTPLGLGQCGPTVQQTVVVYCTDDRYNRLPLIVDSCLQFVTRSQEARARPIVAVSSAPGAHILYINMPLAPVQAIVQTT